MQLSSAITAWFKAAARELPWRTGEGAPAGCSRDPYRTLVSELMLQQTQVSRVIERFAAFIAEFPTAQELARAPESRVLALWSGLGYYRRARLLHAAARKISEEHDGAMPGDLETIRALPGVGAYTAGAISSLAMGKPVPLVDGNVARVLFRIRGREAVHGDPGDMRWAWEEAGRLVGAVGLADRGAPGGVSVAALNEGLMELGATVCTPTSPRCDRCPVQDMCTANRTGRQADIPAPKAAASRKPVQCAVVVVRERGRILVEQRPREGMWGGMWQAPTLESEGSRSITRSRVAEWIGAGGKGAVRASEVFVHKTTHRDVRFSVWEATLSPDESRRAARGRRWITEEEIDSLGISTPQRRILLGARP